MDVANFREIDNLLKEEGCRIKTAHPFFIPRNDEICEMNGIEIRKYNQEEILAFKGDDRFDEAFCFDEKSPDMLACCSKCRLCGCMGGTDYRENRMIG